MNSSRAHQGAAFLMGLCDEREKDRYFSDLLCSAQDIARLTADLSAGDARHREACNHGKRGGAKDRRA